MVYPSDSSKDFTRRYMYDGGEIVAEVDGTNQVLANYTHSNLRTDDVLSVQITAEGKTQGLAKSQGNYFYLKDSLGTITDITDGSGNLIQHFVYSPFGEIIRVTNKLNEDISSDWMIRTSYTFTNREYDEESGLYYYRARYYDASTGRFLQVDPDPGKLSVPSTHVNKYIYVGNNPFNAIDPSGMFSLKKSIQNGIDYLRGEKSLKTRDWINLGIITAAVIIAPFCPYMSFEMIGYIAGSSAVAATFQDGPFFRNFMNNWASGIAVSFVIGYSGVGEAIFGPPEAWAWEEEVLVGALPTAIRNTPPFRDIEREIVRNSNWQEAIVIGMLIAPIFF